MILGEDNQKMSKSFGNVVNPDEVVREYGADTLRLFEMFLGPLEKVKPWNKESIKGVYRFLERVWRLIADDESDGLRRDAIVEAPPEGALHKALHRTIAKVGEDIENLRFNTAISAMMELVNQLYKEEALPRQALETLVLLLSPFAPHLGEELWHRLGHRESLAYHAWPAFDPSALVDEAITVPVQVNGKVRDRVEVPKGASETQVRELVLAQERIQSQVAGKTLRKLIWVQDRLVNLIVG
jgi:leucyl-tRNA synthetase